MAAGTLDAQSLPEAEAEDAPPVPAPSFAEAYAAHFRYVWRCLRSLGVRDGSLDDAVQDVFLVVERKLSGFDGRAELRTWLYAISLRVARRYRHRALRDAEPGNRSDDP